MLSRILNWFARKLLKEHPFDSIEEDTERVSGRWFWVKKWVIVLLLNYVWSKRQRKIGHFTEFSDSLEKSGFLETSDEWQVDKPKKSYDITNERDAITFYAGNVNGDKLFVELVSLPENKGRINVILHLANDKTYVLDQYPETSIFHTDKDSFTAAGLRIFCISPFRKWKIFFNGRLKKLHGSNQDSVHVKFSYTWSPTSLLYEVGSDTDTRLVADILATGFLKDSEDEMKKILDPLEIYEQWGMYVGTIKICTEEVKEITMWGIRERDRSNYTKDFLGDSVAYYGMLKTGKSVSVGAKSIRNNRKQFKHGYIHLQNRQLYPLHRSNIVVEEGHLQSTLYVEGNSTNQTWDVKTLEKITFGHGFHNNSSTDLYFAEFIINGETGHGFVKKTYKTPNAAESKDPEDVHLLLETDITQITSIQEVVKFEEESCQCSKIAGGKGSSLSLLKKLSSYNKQFTVPNGLVITTLAYTSHLQNNPDINTLISKLQKELGEMDVHQLKTECLKVSESFLKTELEENIQNQLESVLKDLFGNNLDATRFAVRSSAIGEDSEETSSAGQMTTILGVKGIDKIFEAVRRCWSSQFSQTAVQYKKQNGMQLNPGMAVVVQEMVPAEVAGVTFTCDPVTGDPGIITITANYGLGESVVSASSEPDTIVLLKEKDGGVSLKDSILGRKDRRIKMDESDGVIEEILTTGEASKYCLSEEMYKKLGILSIKIEEAFNSPRDLEWAIVGSQIYLLQSRPVTTIFKENDYDITHELDNGLLAEFEYFTRANVGEVMPGATTPLTLTLITKGFDNYYTEIRRKDIGKSYILNPYSTPSLSFSSGQVFLSVLDLVIKETDGDTRLSHRPLEISLMGRVLEDHYIQASIERNGLSKHVSISAIRTLWKTYWSYTSSQEVYKSFTEMDLDQYKSSKSLLPDLKEKVHEYFTKFEYHMKASEGSSIFNIITIEILADYYEGSVNELMKDLAMVLTDCSNLESADVPSSLKNLALTIAKSEHKETFVDLELKDAITFLQEDGGTIGQAYSSFITRHAHRCLREFEMAVEPWGDNPEVLVRNLQTMAKNTKLAQSEKKEPLTPWKAANSTKYKLPLPVKLKLWFLIKCARFGVMIREDSKSWIIKMQYYIKKSFKHLGKLLVQEGKLPNLQLMYYLTLDEVFSLIDNNSPYLVRKARHRQNVYKQLDKLKFPEISSGLPKPINNKLPSSTSETSATQVLKGITVSQGIVRGKAQVIMDFEECTDIQQGDILITYSTDVGWTPYFPLLSGVVTELGGLISHGAVVAREYGIPCLVGVEGATDNFKTGDYVELDASRGLLRKVETEEDN